ncbi:MAG TPA: TolC family protein [Thermoanaerobaculia bacterium]|jgi:outer membrane protein TolC|nr:TolC family protein [Thermoanaerobaculia bacterium]
MKSGRTRRAAVACAGFLLLAGSVAAQDQAASARRVETVPTPILASGVDVKDGAVLLSLDEAVEIALRQNVGLSVERYTRDRARLGVEQTLGIYDLLLSGSAHAEDNTSPTTSQLQASQSNLQRLNFGVSQLFPMGGEVTVGWNNSRSENNNPFSRLNPAYNSSLIFGLKQPLLRDFGRLATERALLVAQNRSQASSQEFERQVTVAVQDVIDAYWNLVGARQQLVVARESLSLARELHDRNKIQVDVGTMAPLELVQSEAAVAEREEGIITAQSAVGDAEDVLRRLLNLPQGELWGTEIRPVTDPTIQHQPIDVEAAIQTALAERPELRFQQLDIEQARIQAQYARNQEKPALDLEVGYDFAGVGGDVILRDEDTGAIIGTQPGGYSDALSQVTGLDFHGWSIDLTFGFPLQNRAARTARAIADLDLARAQTAMDDTRSGIITEVRQAARRVETAAKQIEAAKASRVFQERSLEAERKRYENGMSTSFQITQIQEDLSQARTREVNAVVNYRTALAEFQRTTGQLLDVESIEIADEEPPVDRWSFSLRR